MRGVVEVQVQVEKGLEEEGIRVLRLRIAFFLLGGLGVGLVGGLRIRFPPPITGLEDVGEDAVWGK